MSNNNKFYNRVILLTNDIQVGINAPPPSTADIIAAVYDPNNSTMVSSGLYTQDQTNQKIADAFAYFLNTFGLDFANGFPIGGGRIVAGGWILFPYASGVKPGGQINVALDTSDGKGNNGMWRGFQFGQVLAATTSGVFPGGTRAGQSFVAGDVLAYFDYNMLNTNGGPIGSYTQREVLVCRSPWTSKNILNSEGYTDSLSKLEAVDQNGNVGFAMENIVWVKDAITNMVTTRTRVVVTWGSI